ncbi:MAG: hypothetical protein QXP73_06575 [Candidatus Methanomethylicaceae archaeon]
MPYWGQLVSALSPLTFANDLMRLALKGNSLFDPLFSTAILLGFSTAFLYIGRRINLKFRVTSYLEEVRQGKGHIILYSLSLSPQLFGLLMR